MLQFFSVVMKGVIFMGSMDTSMKDFIRINSVFAQLFEKGVYHGKIRIEPNRLTELDSASQDTVRSRDGVLKEIERFRDMNKVIMFLEGTAAFQIVMGVEGQSDIHYYMPVRCMELDALSYSAQCRKESQNARENGALKKYANGVPKGTKIVPVVTLVFYTGTKPWDGPRSIYDMFDIPDSVKEAFTWTQHWILLKSVEKHVEKHEERHEERHEAKRKAKRKALSWQ